jgi:ATP-dependent helicase HrpB
MQPLALFLPIDAVLNKITEALAHGPAAVVVAPPGAGKTTRIPLVLADAPFAAHKKILVLEPRRVAARAAAERMAASLGERVGETVGLRMRAQSTVSDKTQIEVVTEGVFTRMILADPMLEGISAVLFDEFHERSLDADLGLALALDTAAGLREDLRLLVMSATLDGARVAHLLDDAPVIVSEGRAFPVETRYLGRDPREPVEAAAAAAILRALRSDHGSILAFLPGQAEISRTENLLAERLRDPAIEIAPLYAAIDPAAQTRAIAPVPPGRRKIILATSIAETSVTIDGVHVVVDCGLARIPRFEPDRGLTRLETVKVSRASADQRRGRAGRTGPGVCYRLWEEAANGSLEAFTPPEILSCDLSRLVLDLATWGVREPRTLRWLDLPPEPALAEARALLRGLAAIDGEGALTDEGRAIARLALPPRLAKMVIDATREGSGRAAAEIATLIVERGIGGTSPDLAERLTKFRGDSSPKAKDARRLAGNFAGAANAALSEISGAPPPQTGEDADCGKLLALAFPDRVAKARGRPGEFLMANGRAATIAPNEPLAKETYLAIGEISGRAASARILLAAALAEEDLETIAGSNIATSEEIFFDKQSALVRARKRRRLGALILTEQNLPIVPGQDIARVLAKGIAGLGLGRLPWTKPLKQWRDRVLFLARIDREAGWPDLSDAFLAETIADWFAPFLVDKTSLAEISPEDLSAGLATLLAWDLSRRLEEEAPTHFVTPAGSRIALDYGSGEGPVLAARVQEFFGLSTHPSLARGKFPLTLELLSPASRPIQITRDLPGFWRGSWASVKAEMKGRYPRHEWPDDPATANATARAKPRAKA